MTWLGRAVGFGRLAAVAAFLATGCRAESPPLRQSSGEGGAGQGGMAAIAGMAGAGSGNGATAGTAGEEEEAGAGGVAGEPDDGLPWPHAGTIRERACATSTMKSELLPSNLLFVIDRSSSMACNPPPITDSAECEEQPMRADPLKASKWEIMRSALLNAIRELGDETVVGISYFSNDDGCGVQSTPNVELSSLSRGQRGSITASLSNVEPNGATPLVGAAILAYDHLHTQALDGAISGNKFVVLLTDGEQSDACADLGRCSDQEQCTNLLVDVEAKKAAGPGVGIRTFVIGAPGSEPSREVLSRLALSGGTARPNCDAALGNCHFDMTRQPAFEQALAMALSEISGRALSCELQLPRTGSLQTDPDKVNVVYSPASGAASRVVPQNVNFGCDDDSDGWQYIEGKTKIRLCGRACSTVRADRGAKLEVVLGCPVQDVI